MTKTKLPAGRALLAAISIALLAARTTAAPPAGISGDANFATDLFGRVSSANSGNVFVSPYSVRTALTMTAAGARGETARQMSTALHLPIGVQTSAEFSRLTRALVHTNGPTFTVENSIWAQAGMPFERSFLATCTGDFGAAAEQADFATNADGERLKINAWAAKQTHDKITDLLPPGSVNALTRMVLADAVYFKGDWAHPFTANGTSDRPFHLDPTHDVSVKMMARSVDGGMAYDGPTVSMIDLAYAGTKTGLLIIVPKGVDGLPAVQQQLNGEQLRSWVSHLRATDVMLQLPRFKAAGHYSLKQPLADMGMPLAFDKDSANFSGMMARSTGKGVCIGDVIHGSFVTVDEKGTEAAAATAVVMPPTMSAAGGVERKWLEITADRPFLYILRDRPTGTGPVHRAVLRPADLTEVGMLAPLIRIIIFAGDVQRCADFFRDAFGFTVVPSVHPSTEWVELETGGCRLAFHKAYGPDGPINGPTGGPENPHKIAFHVTDVALARAELVGCGAAMGELRTFGSLVLCDGTDPEGHVFQITNRG